MQRRNGPGLPPVLVPAKGPKPNTSIGNLFMFWSEHKVQAPFERRKITEEELLRATYDTPMWYFFATWCRGNNIDPYEDDWMSAGEPHSRSFRVPRLEAPKPVIMDIADTAPSSCTIIVPYHRRQQSCDESEDGGRGRLTNRCVYDSPSPCWRCKSASSYVSDAPSWGPWPEDEYSDYKAEGEESPGLQSLPSSVE